MHIRVGSGLQGRAARYRRNLLTRLPAAVHPKVAGAGALLATLPLIADTCERDPVVPCTALRARRLGLPEIRISIDSGRWFCAEGHAEGSGTVSLTMWLRDCGTLPAVAFVIAACEAARRAAR
jgi:hypothetical protein